VSVLAKIARDLLLGKLPAAAAADLEKSRLAVCQACPEFTKMSRQCRMCSCFMDLKVKLLDASCPIEKW